MLVSHHGSKLLFAGTTTVAFPGFAETRMLEHFCKKTGLEILRDLPKLRLILRGLCCGNAI